MCETPEEQTARLVRQFMEAADQAIADWAERTRQAFEQLTGITSEPEIRAALEQAMQQAITDDGNQPCYCLCSIRHPSDKGICDGVGITTREFPGSSITGPVHVPLCAPCMVAQGVSELTGG